MKLLFENKRYIVSIFLTSLMVFGTLMSGYADENSAPVFIDGARAIRTIAENTAAGVNIGEPVAATDADNDTLTYSKGGLDGIAFSIDTATGQIRTKAALDYETKTAYTFSVFADDGNGGRQVITVTINVTDVDETPANNAPIFTDGTSTTRTVAENTASGRNIGTAIAATDADNDTLTYSLGGTDASSFSIVSTSGQLQRRAALDYETKSSYAVTVSVSDDNGGSDSIEVTISVTDVNEKPSFPTQTATRSIAENTAAGTNIGAPFQATDPDSGDTLTYSLNRGDRYSFRIDPNTGQLRTHAALDFETKKVYNDLAIRATDSEGNFKAIFVTINVTDVNEKPSFPTQTATRTIAENTAAGTNIGEPFQATDPDSGDTLTYSLHRGDASAFRINPTTGQLRTHAALDFETKKVYNDLAIRATDSEGNFKAIFVTINITDVNENRAPAFTDGTSTTRSVAENTASGVNIGSAVSATDADNDALTYTLGGTDAAAFSIVSTSGQLQTNAELDYETKASYAVTVSVSDSNSGSDSIEVTINVTDVNDAPTFTDGTSTTRAIAENTASGTSIGTAVAATDADDDTLTYTLSGTDAAAFSIVSTSGQLQTSAALDYETKASYAVTVSVSDGNSGSDSIEVTVNVTDVVNEPTPVNQRTQEVQDAIVAEIPGVNAPENVTAAHLAEITYLHLKNAGITSLKSFDFDGLTALATLDLEGNSLSALPVGVFDELTALTTLDLQDNSLSALPVGVFDELTALTALYLHNNELTALPEDIFDELTALTALYLHNNELTALPSGIFDELTALTTLYLALNELSSLPSGIFDELTALTELNLVGTGLTTLLSDIFDELTALTTLDLSGNGLSSLPSGIFDELTALTRLDLIHNNLSALPAGIFDELTALTTLDLRVNKISDVSELEDVTSLRTLSLADNPISGHGPLRRLIAAIQEAGRSLSLDITIPPEFTDGTSTTRSVEENVVPGTDIGAVITATDVDNDTLTYSLGGTDAASFSIVSTSGQLQTKAVLDFETKASYTVKVSASDGRGGSDAIDVTINITDVVSEPTPVNQRTQQVQTAIVAAIPGVDSADDVNPVHLAKITTLDLRSNRIGSLKSGDFEGLTALTELDLVSNGLSALPAGVFDELTALTELLLTFNRLSALPAGVFDELTALTILGLDHNQISDTSELEDVTSLEYLYLVENPISDYDPLRSLIAAIQAEDRSLTLDINIPPVFTDGSSTTRSVEENTASGTSIGPAVAATDADGDTLTYTLSGTDAAAFSIVSTSGQLQTSAALDYETKTSYSVTVSVSDGNSGTDTIDVTINVTDIVNDITPVNQRTQQVQDAIVAVILGVNAADDVTEAHLAGITTLDLSEKDITSLKSGDFDGLTALTKLELQSNSLSALPAGIFDELTALTTLYLHNNELTALPSGIFDELTALTTLNLALNELSALPSGIFDELTALTDLNLLFTGLSALPEDIFDELTALTTLNLGYNNISDVSELEGLTSLTNLKLIENPISDYGPLRRLVAAIRADGRSLTIDVTIPNVPPEFTEGTSTTRSVEENTVSGTNIGNAVAATDADGNTLTYSLGGTDAASFSIVSTSGQLQTSAALDYETKTSYSVTVSVSDGNSGTDTIDVTIKVIMPVNQRTQQVQDAIVAVILGVNSADDVTAAHLAEITTLYLRNAGINSLKSGDFDGLTALTELELSNNELAALPAGVFDELTALTTLYLTSNELTALPTGIFDELTALTTLYLAANELTALPTGIFDELTALTTLYLSDNELTALPSGIFDELTALTDLNLLFTGLTALPEDIFDELTALKTLDLRFNNISDVSELEGLKSLTTLSLVENPISDYDPLRRLIAAIEEAGRSLTLDITIPAAAAAPSVQGSSVIPDNTALLSNFPNPFNPETWIPYQLAKSADVTLTIYDIRGRVVRTLLLGHQPAGFYQSRSKAAHWDGRNLVSVKRLRQACISIRSKPAITQQPASC